MCKTRLYKVSVKTHSHQAKAETKVNIFFDACHLFLDLICWSSGTIFYWWNSFPQHLVPTLTSVWLKTRMSIP